MSIRGFILIIILLAAAGGCSKQENLLPDAIKLTLIKKQDFLQTADKKQILFKEITNILPYHSDKLVFLFGIDYEIYISDRELNISEGISLKDKSFYFDDQKIISATLNEDSLYLISNWYNYNILDFKTKCLIKRKFNLNNVPVLISNIAFSNDNMFASAVNQIPKWSLSELKSKKPDNTKLTFGLKHLPNGKAASIYSAPKNLFDYNNFETDNSFVSRSENYIIYSFNISKKVFVFNLNDSLCSHFSLAVDKKHWREPGWEYRSGKKGYRYTSLMYKPLQTKGDYIYQLMIHPNNGESPDIIKYDIQGHIIARYNLPQLKPRYLYNFSIIGNRVYIYSSFDSDIYIYEGID